MKDLVLKVNDKCNFKCDFCSSNKIAENHDDLDINIVKEYLKKERVSNIILNGGDPLLVSVDYYWDLLDFITTNNMDTRISFTTNLLEFKKNPIEWSTLFCHPLVDVCTSFQYGSGRKLATGEVYTEEMFVEIYNLFKRLVDKDLPFIAVVTEENEKYCMDTVKLAQRLETVCRLNGCLKSGRAVGMFPYYKMLSIYLDIIEAGLGDYENNCWIIQKVWKHHQTDECPYNTNCRETLACISPNGTIHSCPSIADDIFMKDIHPGFLEENSAARLPFDMSVLKAECPMCPMTCFCNSCYKRIQDIKDTSVSVHCKKMKALQARCVKVMGEPG